MTRARQYSRLKPWVLMTFLIFYIAAAYHRTITTAFVLRKYAMMQNDIPSKTRLVSQFDFDEDKKPLPEKNVSSTATITSTTFNTIIQRKMEDEPDIEGDAKGSPDVDTDDDADDQSLTPPEENGDESETGQKTDNVLEQEPNNHTVDAADKTIISPNGNEDGVKPKLIDNDKVEEEQVLQPKQPSDNTDTYNKTSHYEGEESTPVAMISFLIIAIIGFLICIVRFARSMITSEQNKGQYQGILNQEDNAEDEEWGWDDNPKSINGSSKIEIPTRSSLKLTNQEETTIPFPSDVRMPSSGVTHRISPANVGGSPQQQLSRRTLTTTNSGEGYKTSNEDDVFAQMGLSSKPTFGPSKVPTTTTSTRFGGDVQTTGSGISTSYMSKKSSSMSSEKKHNAPKILYSAGSDDVGSDWGDDGDLDDLLND